MTSYQNNCQAPIFALTLTFLLCYAIEARACEDLIFSDAWIREPPPVARVAAGYVSITNTTGSPVAIDGFEADCCAHLMAHETVVEEAKTSMRHLSTLIVPGDQTIKLEPLGKHLMLMKPAYALVNGESVDVNFNCGSEDSTVVAFQIIKK